MSLDTYRRHWNDEALTALALRLAPGANADAVSRQLGDALAPVQRLFVRPNQALRDEALVIFDRTFAITGALQLLATVVAFVGVLSALLSLLLEKQREVGILRAVGLTARQLWGLVMLETGLMGAVAGLLAMPTVSDCAGRGRGCCSAGGHLSRAQDEQDAHRRSAALRVRL